MKEKIVKFAFRSIAIIMLFVTLYLFAIGLFYRVDIENGDIVKKNLVFSIASVVVGLFIIVFIPKIIKNRYQKRVNNILFFSCLLLLCLNTTVWIIMAMCGPQNDGKAVYDIAMQIIAGNYEAISPRGSYMSLWPFQSGILLYDEIICRIVPNVYGINPAVFQVLNALYLWGGSVATFVLVRMMSKTEETVTRWIILWFFFWPLFFYVTFYYGEMLSIEAMFVFLVLLELGRKSGKKLYYVCAIFAVLMAVLVRKNVAIFVVAVVIMFVLEAIKYRTKKPIMFALIVILLSLGVAKFPQKFYEYRAGNYMGDGVSSVLYVAMGVQQNEKIHDGYNNGYHWNTYVECDYNAEKANEIAYQSIRNSIKGYLENPKLFVEFFTEKTIAEWTWGDCAAFYSSREPFFYKRSEKANAIFYGNSYKGYLQEMDYYRGILYGLMLIYCIGLNISVWKKEVEFKYTENVLVLTIIGGFIFYVLWEGGSRYILPYLVCMIPLAALSIEKVTSFR